MKLPREGNGQLRQLRRHLQQALFILRAQGFDFLAAAEQLRHTRLLKRQRRQMRVFFR